MSDLEKVPTVFDLPQVGHFSRGGYNFIKRKGPCPFTGEEIIALEHTRLGHTLHVECPASEYAQRAGSMIYNLLGAIKWHEQEGAYVRH